MGAFGPRRVALSGVALVLACQGSAVAADRTASRTTADEERTLAEDDESTLNASSIASLRRKREAIHRGAPIALMVVGGALAIVSVDIVALRGLRGISDSPTRPAASSPTGWYVAGGIGASAAIAGLIWLVDCNIRRGRLEERIEKLSRPVAFDSVGFDANSGRITRLVGGHF